MPKERLERASIYFMGAKSYYREILHNVMKYVKISVLAREYGISQANLSYFMKGPEYDHLLSVNKLDGFINYIHKTLNNFV